MRFLLLRSRPRRGRSREGAVTVTLAAALSLAAAVASCGATNPSFDFGTDGGVGGRGSDSGSSGGSSSSGSSGGVAPGGSGGIVFGDGGGPASRSDAGSGSAGCDPTCTAAQGTCNGAVCTIVENPGAIDPATQSQLQMGGSGDSAFAWLYPYDRTVFGRGLLSPTMQFAGGAADAAYVRITSMTVDYSGYFKIAQSPMAVIVPQSSWEAVAAAALGTDPVQVRVTKSAGGKVSGPIQESWTIAKGNLRGTIYYETYNSAVAGGGAGAAGSVGLMKIQPGAPQPTALKTGCGNVCHTASADGSTLVASTALSSSAAYDLTTTFATIRASNDNTYTYGGLYPDGTFLMTATSYRGAPLFGNTSQLVNTKTGAAIAAPGWDGVITKGGTVAFSPDGKQIAFVHEDKDSGHTLAKMDFDKNTNTFSNLVDLVTDSSRFVAWPAFTPDGKQVVYHAGSNGSFETDCGASGDLYVVDVATKTAHRLDRADGYAGTGSQAYLPANDPDLSFAPTVLPEAVGGYFWAVFTSHRSYGNLLASKANGTGGLAMCLNPGGDEANGKLWVSAIDINPAPGTDPSHPAFFLVGQEVSADNLRGFWVLPPCSKDGEVCGSGDQCCGGYCGQVDGGLQCTSRPPACSNEYDKCSSGADCCDSRDLCINNRCAQPTAQ
jgi:hypothetical protein